MPWTDWQFWVVTVLALGAIAAILAQAGVLRRLRRRGGAPKGGERRVRLTIDGERPERPRRD